MAKLAKFLQGVAGAGGGAGLNVEEVFSTYLYTGTEASTQTITNNIDLAGEGGLVWVKARDGAINNVLMDTEQGVGKFLNSNQNYAQQTNSEGIKSFNTDGFTFGTQTGVGWSNDHVYWTFRKAPKFFDVVTYTGDGTSSRQISHNLGTTVGMTVVKCTSNSQYWHVLHRSGNAAKTLYLNRTDAEVNDIYAWNSTHATSTHFTIGAGLNTSGRTYVAYLFAHNNGDGGFGPTGDQDIIKCGSWTGAGATEVSVSLGFEPQWLLVKKTSATDDWYIIDNMRGQPFGANVTLLSPNTSSAEQESLIASPTADGLITKNWSNGQTFVYIAIRRGPMAVPESATDVFDVQTAGNLSGLYSTSTGFTPDAAFYRDRDSNQNNILQARLTETQLITNSTSSEFTSYNSHLAGNQDGIRFDTTQNYGSSIIYQWKRAPNYFDVVAYTGDGTTSRYVNHNLEVIPELVIIKRRSSTGEWWVDHDGAGAGKVIYFNRTNAAFSYTAFGTHTSTQIQLETAANNDTNASGSTYIAYLFASLAGISKVGSYTGTGTAGLEVDCGFTTGARFFFVKRAAGTGSWYLWDSARGITAGNDPYLALDSTAAEFAVDIVDPFNAGFIMNSTSTVLNASGETYIFYAIA